LPGEEPAVDLSLPLKTAETLHATLENLLESGCEEAALKEAYRLLSWRILASKKGAGLTRRLSELARRARSVEEYEVARDKALGPILDGLENAENRDP
jgi:hypothetical protein